MGLFNPADFARRLRQERVRIDLNQKDFGRLAGVGLQTQSRYENAETMPNAEYLAALIRAGVDICYLLTGLRSESVALSSDASEVVTVFLSLTPPLQRASMAVLLALKAECDDPPTLHESKTDYRAE